MRTQPKMTVNFASIKGGLTACQPAVYELKDEGFAEISEPFDHDKDVFTAPGRSLLRVCLSVAVEIVLQRTGKVGFSSCPFLLGRIRLKPAFKRQ